MNQDFAKKVYQQRPSLILNIDNEYMTFLLGENIKEYYGKGAIPCP